VHQVGLDIVDIKEGTTRIRNRGLSSRIRIAQAEYSTETVNYPDNTGEILGLEG